ncbi:MAG: tRNA (adenosine(37)-N6)-threonylcarbamoyltransferase complex transferase subunit TsaD [Bdellovibrionales bacterium]|nr:tRNA (adenosine(37)-N6)-threonylcarbamoyltransferase complex transferase subunit TsaD [Bdellovibrionales bacterium]
MKVLAVETSCDDTCVSVVDENGFVDLSLRQDQDEIHSPFGGIVPERASRNHSRHLLSLLDQAFNKISIEEISLLAFTSRPGLMGSLLVGSVTTRTLSELYEKPVLGINHIEGHILSPFLWDKEYQKKWSFPYLALVVSGGHTHLFEVQSLSKYILIGKTLDDAAGEAFDKFARFVGLPYPGGVYVDKTAQKGECSFSFPVAMDRKGLDFSFSGLKTSAHLLLQKVDVKKHRESLCASFQDAVVRQIMNKLEECIHLYPDYKRVAVVGGVSANSYLRKKCTVWAEKNSIDLALPPLRYCTDNAAMIGYTAIQKYLSGNFSKDLSCSANHRAEDFIGI